MRNLLSTIAIILLWLLFLAKVAFPRVAIERLLHPDTIASNNLVIVVTGIVALSLQNILWLVFWKQNPITKA